MGSGRSRGDTLSIIFLNEHNIFTGDIMAIFLSNVALAIIMMTVITKDQILDDIIIGMPEKEMLEVFAELTDQSRINYYTVSTTNTVGHVLQGDEIGYYIIGLGSVRDHWWHLPLGRRLSVVVVISKDSKVADIKFYGGRVGWP
jgi:hypothetical protein